MSDFYNGNARLFVRNLEQAAIMLEMDGQISDGMWENTRPYEHWKIWCDAKIVVRPEAVGRDFSCRKDNYNLTSPELLNVVGKRMLGTIRIARRFGMEIASVLEHLVSTDGTFKVKSWNTDNIATAAKMAGLPEGTFCNFLHTAIADETYTYKMMMKDLKDLKVIFKTRIY